MGSRKLAARRIDRRAEFAGQLHRRLDFEFVVRRYIAVAIAPKENKAGKVIWLI
jgi:hypothetical protein